MVVAILLIAVVLFVYSISFSSRITEIKKTVVNLERAVASRDARIDRMYNDLLKLNNKVEK